MDVIESKLVKAALGFKYYFPGTISTEKRVFESCLELNTNPLPHTTSSFKRKRDDNDDDDDDDIIDYGSFPLSSDETGKFASSKPQHPDHIQAESVVIEKGKPLDVLSLLSGDKDDDLSYFGRIHGGVGGIDMLQGKYLLVCCFYAPILYRNVISHFLPDLCLLSSELYATRRDFEMVLVIKMRPEWAKDSNLASSHFQHLVSGFSPSCMFVPFEHADRIDRICKSINTERAISGFLVGPDGVVVQDSIRKLVVHSVGKDIFPFTDEKIRHYSGQCWNGRTLEDMLESEGSRVLYNNGGDKQVTVSELARKKLVWLYLCGTGYDIPLMDRVYHECRAKQLEFEIVLVYNPFVTNTRPCVMEEVIGRFLDKRKISSWWVFPFTYLTVSRLFDLAGFPITDSLLTVSYGKVVDYGVEKLVRAFGSNVYPFDIESVIQNGRSKIQRVTLESLLAGGTLVRGNYEVVSLTYLRGRNVLVFLGSAEMDMDMCSLLEEHYNSIKRRHAGFEVVFVNLDTYITNKGKQMIDSMPWLVFYPHPWMPRSVVEQLSMWGFEPSPAFVAFGENGRISSLDADSALEEDGPDAFPFAGDVLRQIDRRLEEHLYDLSPF